MKGFQKLALVTAIAALPVSGFAMEALDEATMAEVTGQDGISISLSTNLTTDIAIHDTDGFTGLANAGAILITGAGINTGAGNIVIGVDAGTGAAEATPTLNVNVSIPTGTTIALGDLSVAGSGRDDATPDWTTPGATATIMSLGTVTLGATTLNIQLGNEPQGNMIDLATTITGGVSIAGFAINDAGGTFSGGSISVGTLSLVDSGGTDLTVDVGVDAVAAGLRVDIAQLGDATNGFNMRMDRVRLGDGTAPFLGDVELRNLNLNGTVVTISGK